MARGYLRDDVIGKSGIEASFEEELRGKLGSQLVERDASGRLVKVIDTLREPVPGTNLMLTIDTDMQRLATKALEWGMQTADVSQGVTVVMNPQNGEILAMVSLPAYDNNKFAGGISVDDFNVYLTDPDRPLRNHAISDIFPPGSTYKLVTAIAAMEEGVTTAARQWPTYGCYQIPGAPDGQCLFDWNRQGFGPLAMVDAFAKSSDTFFYQMAIDTGVDRLARWANELGFGELSGIRLPGEEEGIIASTEWARQQGRAGRVHRRGGAGRYRPERHRGHAAPDAERLCGGRERRSPHAADDRSRRDRCRRRADARLRAGAHPRDLAADPDTLRTMRIGAREVITSGHAYNIRDLDLPGALSGKTGTAEFGELTAEGTLPFHSWFVAYLPSAPAPRMPISPSSASTTRRSFPGTCLPRS